MFEIRQMGKGGSLSWLLVIHTHQLTPSQSKRGNSITDDFDCAYRGNFESI